MEDLREKQETVQESPKANAADQTAVEKQKPRLSEAKRRLSFKEKQEYEQLGKDIEALEAEKKQIEEALSSGTISVDEITSLSKRLPILTDELDEKEMRWLELDEWA